jgi:ergothioneine biosynthesis protein EgtB
MTSQETKQETMGAATLAERCRTLAARFAVVRQVTLRFTDRLSAEDQMVQSCAEASPTKWHLAHTSWFFETFVLAPYAAGYQAFHPEFHWLFNSYYNALGEMPAKKLRASFSRPGLDAILAYRTHVDGAIADLLAAPAHPESEEIVRRIALGLEHEQQHLELIATDIKHALYTNPLHPVYRPGENPAAPCLASETWDGCAPTFSSFAGGLTEIGITPDANDPLAFAFDNETPRHTVYLQPFALANRLVTVAEYLAFINDNGYTRPELWLSEGWTLERSEGWQAPLYWQRDPAAPSGWSVYTLRGIRPIGLEADEVAAAPVCHLSFFEADAYARWAGARLPTEFEWEHAAAALSSTVDGAANMLESDRLHPAPAAEVSGLQQCFGDVWEWTSSGYTGYPGYRPLPGALGEYNGKFMSSQVILRGGSCVTPATHIRATYRNFFPPQTRWQFSGLRVARDL